MPELPEVETTILDLRKKVLKRAFIDVWTDFKKMVKNPEDFEVKFMEMMKRRRRISMGN